MGAPHPANEVQGFLTGCPVAFEFAFEDAGVALQVERMAKLRSLNVIDTVNEVRRLVVFMRRQTL